MPRVSKDFKAAIERLTLQDLQKLVVELAKKNKEAYDYINLTYLPDEKSEEDLFREYEQKALAEFYRVYNRGIVQKNLAAAMTRAVRHINYFEKVTKNELRTAELLVSMLDEVYDDHTADLGSCWTAFDSKLATTTNRLYNLVTKKIHPDHHIQFRAPINKFLKILDTECRHLDYVYNMPKQFPE